MCAGAGGDGGEGFQMSGCFHICAVFSFDGFINLSHLCTSEQAGSEDQEHCLSAPFSAGHVHDLW
jgi:hypothetical protein